MHRKVRRLLHRRADGKVHGHRLIIARSISPCASPFRRHGHRREHRLVHRLLHRHAHRAAIDVVIASTTWPQSPAPSPSLQRRGPASGRTAASPTRTALPEAHAAHTVRRGAARRVAWCAPFPAQRRRCAPKRAPTPLQPTSRRVRSPTHKVASEMRPSLATPACSQSALFVEGDVTPVVTGLDDSDVAVAVAVSECRSASLPPCLPPCLPATPGPRRGWDRRTARPAEPSRAARASSCTCWHACITATPGPGTALMPPRPGPGTAPSKGRTDRAGSSVCRGGAGLRKHRETVRNHVGPTV